MQRLNPQREPHTVAAIMTPHRVVFSVVVLGSWSCTRGASRPLTDGLGLEVCGLAVGHEITS